MGSSNAERKLGTAIIIIIFLLGIILLALAIIFSAGFAQTVVGGIGAGLITSGIVLSAQRSLPTKEEKITIIRGHRDIYKEFTKMIRKLSDEKPHIIRTINSFPPEEDCGTDWDEVVTKWLRECPDSRFIRVIISQNTNEWNNRLNQIAERYTTRNYKQYTYTGPPTPEIFLVDTDEVLISFSTHEIDCPPITSAIKIRDKRFCEQLQAYHRVLLEKGNII